jgi:ferric-dicitrate binding protein FerR (iron transport regulator)
MQKDFEILLINYFSNEASDDEIKLVKKLVSESKENRRLFDEYRQMWLFSNPKSKDQINVDKAWSYVSSFQKERSYTFLKVASIAILLVVSYLIGQITTNYKQEIKYYSLEVPKAQTSKFELIDGTKINLNSDTKIKYANNFSEDNREIYFEGEAFFNVKRSETSKFIINTTDNLSITVLGTSFNFKSYPNSDIISVSLQEGSVIITENKNQNILKPGEKYSYNKRTKLSTIEHTNLNIETSWMRNKIIIEDEKFESLIKTIERKFDKKIIIVDEELKHRTITASFMKHNLSYILGVLKGILPIRYEINENTIKIRKED